MSFDSSPTTPRMATRQQEFSKDHRGMRDMLVVGRSLVKLDEAGQPVKQEEFNHHKMQGAAQVRFLSESLEELKKEVEILRGQGEHMKLRVARTIEDHSKRLEMLEGSPQRCSPQRCSPRLAPRPVEVQSSKVVEDADGSPSIGKNPMQALEARVDLLEGISRATTLMCTEIREEASDKEQSLRLVLEQEVLMRATAADADEAARRALEKSIQKLEDSSKAAQVQLGERLEALEAKSEVKDFSERIRTLEGKVRAAPLEDFSSRLITVEAKVGPAVEAVHERVRQGLQSLEKDVESRSASVEQRLQQVEEGLGHKAEKELEGRLKQLEQEHKGCLQQLEQGHEAEQALESRVQQLEQKHEAEQALEGRVRQLEQAKPVVSAGAEQVEALASKLKEEEEALQAMGRQIEKDKQRCDEACKTAGKVEALQVQLSLTLQEERRLRAEGERAMEERFSKACVSCPLEGESSLDALKAMQQQCSAELEKEAATRAEAVQALRQDLAELAERGGAVVDGEAVSQCSGVSKFIKEERERVERALSQQARRLCEDNASRMEELFKKEAATRVDKLFKLSQRIETIEKEMPKAERIREAQSQLQSAMDAEAKNQEKVHLQLTEQLEQVLRTIEEQQKQGVEEQRGHSGDDQSPHADFAQDGQTASELVAQVRERTLAATQGARNDGALACALGTGACMLLGLCMRAKGNANTLNTLP